MYLRLRWEHLGENSSPAIDFGLAALCLSFLSCKMGRAEDLLHAVVIRIDGDDAGQVFSIVTGT